MLRVMRSGVVALKAGVAVAGAAKVAEPWLDLRDVTVTCQEKLTFHISCVKRDKPGLDKTGAQLYTDSAVRGSRAAACRAAMGSLVALPSCAASVVGFEQRRGEFAAKRTTQGSIRC